MKKGGNAFDAAIAAMATLSVTRPLNCGIGGGGFATLYVAKEKRVLCIDGREQAPRSARSTMFLNSSGVAIPFAARISQGTSIGIPGTVAMMEQITKFGNIQCWESLFGPAHYLAKNGFTVDAGFNFWITQNIAKFLNFPYTTSLFLTGPGNTAPPVGSTFTNPDLAKTIKQLAEKGPCFVYRDSLARDIAATVQNPQPIANPTFPGVGPYPVKGQYFTVDDLQLYKALVVEPIVVNYRGFKVCMMPPPSSGGITIGMMLKMLQSFPMDSIPVDLAFTYFLNAEELAFADRALFMGDAVMTDVPIVGLLSDGYNNARQTQILSHNIFPVVAGNPFAFQPSKVSGKCLGVSFYKYQERQLEIADKGTSSSGGTQTFDTVADADDRDTDTTNLVIVDEEGNVIDVTFTIEQIGAGGIAVPGRGFLLNNELTDFDPTPGSTNEVGPLKRPRSSMSPTIVLNKHDQPVYALGCAGGSRIIPTIAQHLIQLIDFGYTIVQSEDAMRVSNMNSATSTVEPPVNSALLTQLTARGFTFSAPAAASRSSIAKINGGPRKCKEAVAEDSNRFPFAGSALSIPSGKCH